ncbi:MAG: MBL fold metallo-hydrolase [Clostridia bacterium]|nr:MBL fold metallo-hydrolase [Clostridia bacterium]
MSETALYLQTETSDFMMSIILKTKKGNAVVIDGGRPEDLPLLWEIVGGCPVKAWILTHPHLDHITGFTKLIADRDISRWPEKVYYNFPTAAFMEETEPAEAWTLRDFLAVEDSIGDRRVCVQEGDTFDVDELHFTILQSWDPGEPIVPAHPGDHNSTGNENSLVFRIDTPGQSVLILGDAGPLAGDRLMSRHWQDLKADIVQMAHHGHGGVGAEVYLAASPKACLWCCRDWLYNEKPFYLNERLWGTIMTRKWMEWMGVQTHYVTKDGTHKILL